MARRWYVGYFYHGYLKKLIATMEVCEELKDVKMWYPYVSEIRVKNGARKCVKVPMFHNYVLFEFEEGSLIWKDIIRETPIISFLKSSENYPIPIEQHEVEHIKKIESKAVMQDFTYLIGKEVVIKDGHFEGFTGKCISIIKGRYKAKVLIQMFNLVEMTVEINLEDIRLL